MSEVWAGESVACLSLASGVCPAILTSLAVDTSPQSLSSSSHGALPVCVCAQISSFYTDTSHIDQGPTPLPYDLILTLTPFTTILFPNKVTFGGTRN